MKKNKHIGSTLTSFLKTEKIFKAVKKFTEDKIFELMKCKVHPKYRAVGKPTGKCDKCWEMWSRKHK